MPNDVKLVVSLVSLLVALGLAYLAVSPIRTGYGATVIMIAVFFVAAMWIFPEAGVKKGIVKKRQGGGAA